MQLYIYIYVCTHTHIILGFYDVIKRVDMNATIRASVEAKLSDFAKRADIV